VGRCKVIIALHSIILVLALLCPPVHGDSSWSLYAHNGTWLDDSDTAWDTGDVNTGSNNMTLVFHKDITSFVSWYASYNAWCYVEGLEWFDYIWGTVKHMNQQLYLSVSNSNFPSDVLEFRMDLLVTRGLMTLGGASSMWRCCYRMNPNDDWLTVYDYTISPIEVWDDHDFSIAFYFVKTSDTLGYMRVSGLTDRNSGIQVGSNTAYNFTDISVPSGFFSNCRLIQKISVNGDGRALGFKDGESFTKTVPDEEIASELFFLQKIWQALTSPIYDILPQSLRDIVDVCSVVLGSLTDLVGALIQVALVILPYLPFVFMFWLADVGITAVNKGSFQPIGVAWSTIFQVLSQLGNWVVTVAETIWSFIHFW
jgi:hypothetical protein